MTLWCTVAKLWCHKLCAFLDHSVYNACSHNSVDATWQQSLKKLSDWLNCDTKFWQIIFWFITFTRCLDELFALSGQTRLKIWEKSSFITWCPKRHEIVPTRTDATTINKRLSSACDVNGTMQRLLLLLLLVTPSAAVAFIPPPKKNLESKSVAKLSPSFGLRFSQFLTQVFLFILGFFPFLGREFC